MTCGTCCFSKLDTYVRVTGDDHLRLGQDVTRLVRFVGNQAFMQMIDGHCAGLAIDMVRRRFVCSVYETRPQTCRDLARGSPACEGEIATKGDRPLKMLDPPISGSTPLV